MPIKFVAENPETEITFLDTILYKEVGFLIEPNF